MTYCTKCGKPTNNGIMCEDCIILGSPWLLAMKSKEDDLVEQNEKLKSENAALRDRLKRAVELPLVQTIRGNKLPYEVVYKDGNGRIIVTKYRRWQKKQAEARLKELQGGER